MISSGKIAINVCNNGLTRLTFVILDFETQYNPYVPS